MATFVTYRTGQAAGKLRTVVVDEVRTQVVLLPTGRLPLVTGKQLCGTTCATPDWAEWLGTDPSDDTFSVAASQVIQVKEIKIATIASHRH